MKGEEFKAPDAGAVDRARSAASTDRRAGEGQRVVPRGVGEMRQNTRRISVIIGNPPYNANQANENDNNKNREYPHIDARIKQTYIAESTPQKTKLYDINARFFRWASDRPSENGVLAFVSNRSFIESRTFDGFRKTVAQEFSEIQRSHDPREIRHLPLRRLQGRSPAAHFRKSIESSWNTKWHRCDRRPVALHRKS